MATYVFLVGVYVVGGLTCIPLLLLLIFCHAYLTQPIADSLKTASSHPSQEDHTVGKAVAKDELAGLPPGISPRGHEPDVAAGYFAVCRDYVPGGVNGKAPDRTSPASTVVATESPSVWFWGQGECRPSDWSMKCTSHDLPLTSITQDRRPLSPPPIIRLWVTTANGEPVDPLCVAKQ